MLSGIVYCLSRKDSEQVCLDLCGKGISAGCYHADLPPAERSRVHRQWLNTNVQVRIKLARFLACVLHCINLAVKNENFGGTLTEMLSPSSGLSPEVLRGRKIVISH